MPEETDTRRTITTLLDFAGITRLEQIFALGPANPRPPALPTEPALVHLVEEWPRDE